MDPVLIDLLFGTDLTFKEIAIRIGQPYSMVKERVAQLGLGWVRPKEGMSRGQAALTTIMERLLPGESVVSEYPIGERLELDVFCPRYKIAAEYHGQQHFVYVEHFHRDMDGFHASMRRDKRKAQLCAEKGIALVVFSAQDPMTEDYVFRCLLEAMKAMDPVLDRCTEKKVDPYKQEQLEKAREYRKRTYRRIKLERKL